MLSGRLDGKEVWERMDTDTCMLESLCCPLETITTFLINYTPICGWMWEWDYEESWEPKNWCFWTMVLEKTLESPLDCKEIQPVHPKGISPEYSLEGLMLKLKLPILWPPTAKNWLIEKDSDAGKNWRQEEKWTTEDEMVGWHYRLNGHEFE